MAPGAVNQTPSLPSTPEIIRSAKQVSPVTTPTGSAPSSTSSGSTGFETRTKARPDFQDETERLRSFGTWPSTAPISKDKVARAGFYYLGNELEVACPFCKIEISDWSFNDVALRKHKERSPECPYVLKILASATTSIEQIMKDPRKRFSTFETWPKPQIDPQRLVNAGFYYLQEGDKVRCAWCLTVIEQWTEEDAPFNVHAMQAPTCPFVLRPPDYACNGEDECGHRNMGFGNASKKNDTGLPDGVVRHMGPKHPQMVSSSARLNTFTGQAWPSTAKVNPNDLVEAGFYFLGMHDYTKCFHCDGGLCNWEEGDSPWVEHARWFPKCQFVKLNKGDAFIQECQQVHAQMMEQAAFEAVEETFESTLPKNLTNELEAIMQSPEVSFFLENGVPSQVLRLSLKKFMVDNERGFRSREEMKGVLSQVLCFSNKAVKPDSNTAGSTSVENIPENVLCRVCMAQERGVVFLPCGHLATCPSCAASVTECVMCRTPIAGTLRTFLS